MLYSIYEIHKLTMKFITAMSGNIWYIDVYLLLVHGRLLAVGTRMFIGTWYSNVYWQLVLADVYWHLVHRCFLIGNSKEETLLESESRFDV